MGPEAKVQTDQTLGIFCVDQDFRGEQKKSTTSQTLPEIHRLQKYQEQNAKDFRGFLWDKGGETFRLWEAAGLCEITLGSSSWLYTEVTPRS